MILLTGPDGFVSRQVMRCLVEQGRPLRLVLRSGSPALARLSHEAEVIETPDLFQADPDWWRAALFTVSRMCQVGLDHKSGREKSHLVGWIRRAARSRGTGMAGGRAASTNRGAYATARRFFGRIRGDHRCCKCPELF
jgi:hypothetical protein